MTQQDVLDIIVRVSEIESILDQVERIGVKAEDAPRLEALVAELDTLEAQLRSAYIANRRKALQLNVIEGGKA